jgi:hypothetical protein
MTILIVSIRGKTRMQQQTDKTKTIQSNHNMSITYRVHLIRLVQFQLMHCYPDTIYQVLASMIEIH